jgi:hypothetical protein
MTLPGEKMSREKTFMDWLFGSNPPPEAELAIHLGEARERIDHMQRAFEEQRASHAQECEAMRQSRAESEVRLTQRQRELALEVARVKQDLLDSIVSRDKATAEVARLSRAAVESRAASLRDAEARRKLAIRCSTLESELERSRSEREASQVALEHEQGELRGARSEAERLRHELQRQKESFEQAHLRQREAVEAERRAWGSWLGDVWSALSNSVGSAAPLALEEAFGALEPVARAATPQAAEAHLRDLVAVRSLCSNVTIREQQQELRLDLELGAAIGGTAAGWLGIVATRYLGAMLERPLRTRALELTGERLVVHALRRHPGTGASERHPTRP